MQYIRWDYPYVHVKTHLAFASGETCAFYDINTGLGAFLPDFGAQNPQRGQQAAQTGQYSRTTQQAINPGQSSGTTKQGAQTDNPRFRRKVGNWFNPGHAGIR